MISKEAIEEFKVLYKKVYGEDISDQEALKRATNLLNLYSIVYSPVKKEWLEELDENNDRQNKAFDILFDEVERTRKNSE